MKYTNVLIFGMAKSGFAAARLLHSKSVQYSLYDAKKIEDFKLSKNQDTIVKSAKNLFLGQSISEKDIRQFDLIVISPAISFDMPILKGAREIGIKVIGELELGYLYTNGKIIAITGTNGKTTTTNLVYEIFKYANLDAKMVGNIGIPLCDELCNGNDISTYYICEVSSYQLESIQKFKPDVALITNISPDHLERHGNIKNYIDTKLNIIKNMGEHQYLVYKYEDEQKLGFNKTDEKKRISFLNYSLEYSDADYFLKNKKIYKKNALNDVFIYDVSNLKLLGMHNVENVLSAIAIADLYKIDISIIREAIDNFKGVKHRLEYVDEVRGVKFYNDSKATNPEASVTAISSIKDPIILMAGGSYKNVDYTQWASKLKNVKYIVLYGQTKYEIEKILKQKSIFNYAIKADLEEAFYTAFENAILGDSILLSPACASFDDYDNFEKRGEHFSELVKKLKKLDGEDYD